MSDGVTESYLAELEECRAAYRVALNELRERNEDLREWRPKVEALAEALLRVEWVFSPYEQAYYCPSCDHAKAEGHKPDCKLAEALANYRGEKP